jgi:lysophospholipase L1-like esterase
MVAKYNLDYLLVLLGFNDVGWFISDADGTLRSMEAFINQARAAKPGLAFALANIPQRTFIGGREDLPIKTTEYNEMLAAAIPSWSTPASPIALVEMQENYDCGLDDCPAGYDGLHPDILGKFV